MIRPPATYRRSSERPSNPADGAGPRPSKRWTHRTACAGRTQQRSVAVARDRGAPRNDDFDMLTRLPVMVFKRTVSAVRPERVLLLPTDRQDSQRHPRTQHSQRYGYPLAAYAQSDVAVTSAHCRSGRLTHSHAPTPNGTHSLHMRNRRWQSTRTHSQRHPLAACAQSHVAITSAAGVFPFGVHESCESG